jgi:hypothetical protein
MFDIKKFKPCAQGFKYCADRTPEAAWKTCRHGNWMLWIAQQLNVDDKLLSDAHEQCIRAVKNIDSVTAEEDFEMANICRRILTDEVFKKIK